MDRWWTAMSVIHRCVAAVCVVDRTGNIQTPGDQATTAVRGRGGGNDEQHQVHSLQKRMLPLFGVAQSLRLFGAVLHFDAALPAALKSSWAAASAAR